MWRSNQRIDVAAEDLSASANAKINVGLHVLRRRPDGYHDIDTVFVRIGWSDQITVRRSGDLSLDCSDPRLPADGSNLCLRAARRLREQEDVRGGAHIILRKHLPFGAGLGGGSADAATTLELLNYLWGTGLSATGLLEIGRSLGSDVPFFLSRGVLRGTGRGDRLHPVSHAPYMFPFYIVVVSPGIHVSSAEAYASVSVNASARPDLAEVVLTNDLDCWRREIGNDFEASVVRMHPEIGLIKALLKDSGAGFALMSGSGSAVYGLFEAVEVAAAAAERPELTGYRVWRGTATPRSDHAPTPEG